MFRTSLSSFLFIVATASVVSDVGAFVTPPSLSSPLRELTAGGKSTSSIVAPSPVSPEGTSKVDTRLFFFGAAKDDGKPGDYLCKDCGYVFTKGPAAWAKLPDSYGCPPCGSPKFRFKKVPKGSSSGKVEVKKSWF